MADHQIALIYRGVTWLWRELDYNGEWYHGEYRINIGGDYDGELGYRVDHQSITAEHYRSGYTGELQDALEAAHKHMEKTNEEPV